MSGICARRAADANFAHPVVAVPRVVQERDAAIDGIVDEVDNVAIGHIRPAEMEAAEADAGDVFPANLAFYAAGV